MSAARYIRGSAFLSRRNSRAIDRPLAAVTFFARRNDERQGGNSSSGGFSLHRRQYHLSSHQSSGGLIVGGLALAAASYFAQYGMRAYKKVEETQEGTTESKSDEQQDESTARASDNPSANSGDNSSNSSSSSSSSSNKSTGAEAKQSAKGAQGGGSMDDSMEAFFSSIGAGTWKDFKASLFTKNFYDGGFEDKMTKREAALILGVRESASLERVKEAHRRVLLLNHPDRGGSAFLAAKINEAKDLLIKGK